MAPPGHLLEEFSGGILHDTDRPFPLLSLILPDTVCCSAVYHWSVEQSLAMWNHEMSIPNILGLVSLVSYRQKYSKFSSIFTYALAWQPQPPACNTGWVMQRNYTEIFPAWKSCDTLCNKLARMDNVCQFSTRFQKRFRSMWRICKLKSSVFSLGEGEHL